LLLLLPLPLLLPLLCHPEPGAPSFRPLLAEGGVVEFAFALNL